MKASVLHKDNTNNIEALKGGLLICSSCGHQNSIDGIDPLGMVSCSSCGGPNLVPKKIGKFWLFHPLSSRGGCAVYKAYHEEFHHHLFAVKIIQRDDRQNPNPIEKLQKEADFLYKLGRHACLFAGVESGFEDGEHYLAMEFNDGDRLDTELTRRGALPEIEVLITGLRLLSALTHIYNRGYIHRNVRPENVIISQPEGAYLFGYELCQPIDSAQEEHPAENKDLLCYASPERFLGEPERPYSEIYSLGMVLYHLLTGTPYFTEEELKKQVIKLRGEYLALSKTQDKMKDISSDIADIITRMIRRIPEQRYQHFYDVEVDVLEALNSRF